MKKIEELWSHDVSEDIKLGNVEHLARELEKGWNINEPLVKYAKEGEYVLPLQLAIQSNHIKSVAFFVEHGAILDTEWDHAFIYAIRYADEAIIRYVVAKGAKVKVRGKSINAYDVIVQRNRLQLIPLAIELGLPIHPYAQNAFLTEIYHNNYEALASLISYGIDINFNKKTNRNVLGDTPLCHAAIYCDAKMIVYLIEHGADSLIPNKSGKRPYLLALTEGRPENAQVLRKYEPNNNTPDEKVVKKLPKDLLEFLEKGKLKISLSKELGIEYIEFLETKDLVIINIAGRKSILLTREVENYSSICLLWNFKKKCVSYYDEELNCYGEFGVGFMTFMNEIERYMRAIFTDEFRKYE